MKYSNVQAGAMTPALAHLSEETMDLYACGRLSGGALDLAEEHLLICDACRERQQEADTFYRTLKKSPSFQQSRPGTEPRWYRSWSRIPLGWWWAPALAALALVLAVSLPRGANPEPVELQLRAQRGGSGEAAGTAGRPLILRLDLSGVEARGELRAEMVNEDGSLREGMAVKRENGLAVARAGAAPPGVYWIRLYTGNQLLREYALPISR